MSLLSGADMPGSKRRWPLPEWEKKPYCIRWHLSMIGSMPCNPSVGGPAKGIVVREIDALGGEMGRAADATALQFKMLNTTKGPGVQSLAGTERQDRI